LMMMMLKTRFIIKIFWTVLICTHLIMIALWMANGMILIVY
jgi:hypothetical protein